MEKSVTLCIVQQNDIPRLQDVCIQAYNAYFANHWNGDGHARYLHKEFNTIRLLKDIQDPNLDYYFIQFNNQDAGFVKLMYNAPAIDGTHIKCGEIVKIYMLSDFAGQGIGSLAMSLIEDHFKTHNRQSIYLKVVDTNKAISFYEQSGFSKHGRCELDEPDFKEAFKGMFLMVKNI